MKYIYDEVHGYIPLNDLERKIVDTPTFQRLRRVKQLAQAWFVYPGAVHTRFSHSLGAMYLMDKIASKLIREGHIRRDDRELLKVAALLHDIGHTPYSHAIESFFNIKYRLKHEDISAWIITEDPLIKETLREHGIEPYEVAAIIRGRHRESCFNMLMSSDMDVDRLDYLLRDALHTGVRYGIIDLDRIVQTLTLDEEGYVAVPQKSVQAAESFYIARLHMYRSVYYHKTIAAYQLLIQDIYKLMIAYNEVKEYLEPFTDPEGIRKAVRTGKIFLWDDFYVGGLMNFVISRGLGDEKLRELIKLYLEREGYRAVYEWIGFGTRSPIPKNIVKALNSLGEKAREDGYDAFGIKTYIETIPIITEGAEVRVITRYGSVSINKYKGSIIPTFPESMGIVRIYTLPVTEGYASRLVSEFLHHHISV